MSEPLADPALNPRVENPLLEVEGLSLWIGRRQVLRDVSFKVPKGQITAIIGASGTGKSVLLKAIVHLLEAEVPQQVVIEGDILFTGCSVFNARSPKSLGRLRRRVAFVSQLPCAFPMSIAENVSLGIEFWRPGLRRAARERLIERSLRAVGLWSELEHRLDESAKTLSAGQLQRLALARALALEPDLVLLDEPCAYLDPIAIGRFEELVQELKGRLTVLMVTHNMQQASRVSDYTLFMYFGELVEFSLTEKLFINPLKKLTEDYITGRFG